MPGGGEYWAYGAGAALAAALDKTQPRGGTVTADPGRYERMATRARDRRIVREELTRTEWLAVLEPAFPALPGEDPPTVDPGGPHHGHRMHSSWYHLGTLVCSCGDRILGAYSFVVPDDYETPPSCEICDARGVSWPDEEEP